MSKSYWLKDEDQTGNFSNERQDSFDRLKAYAGVRMQKGVPMLDRDWNELEDIRRYQELMLRRHYIGNGAPDENSFKITAADPPGNDFKIARGRCLVGGMEAVNKPFDDQGGGVGFILYSGQEGVEPLTTSSVDRKDNVYLDVWIEEITSAQDEALNNANDVRMETCVRHKVRWLVKVDEGSRGIVKEPFHYYYTIARLIRPRGKVAIQPGDIVDFRQTGLSLHRLTNLSNADASHKHSRLSAPDGSPDPALVVDTNGNIGIGTPSPGKKLHVKGGYAVFEASGGSYTFFGAVDNVEHNGYLELINSTVRASAWGLKAGGLLVSDTYAYANPGKNDLVVKGKVGIGTPEPVKNLHIRGAGTGPVMNDGNDRPGLAITGHYPQLDLFSSVISNANHGPAIRLGGYNDGSGTSYKHWAIGTAARNCRFLDIGIGLGSHPNPHHGIRNASGRTVLTLLENGCVGIGTTEPNHPFHVKTGENVGLFESTGPQAYLRLYTAEGSGNRVEFCNRPGGRAAIYTSGWGDAINVLRNGNVGIGTTAPGFKLHVNGNLHVRSWMTVGSDYSEYFESTDGKSIPVGTSVVLENGKIRRAKKNEAPMGIISASPGMAGGIHVEWPGKFLKDKFGIQIMEEYKEEIMTPKKEKVKKERQKMKKKKIKEEVKRTEVVKVKGKYRQKEITETVEREIEEPVFKEVDLYDSAGKNKIGKHKLPVMETYEEEIDVLDDNGQPVMVGSGKFETKKRPKLNPDYDESKTYIPRQERPEWNCVGLLGQLPLRKGQPVASSWIKIKDISKDVQFWLVK
jgi:hypothetical protein